MKSADLIILFETENLYSFCVETGVSLTRDYVSEGYTTSFSTGNVTLVVSGTPYKCMAITYQARISDLEAYSSLAVEVSYEGNVTQVVQPVPLIYDNSSWFVYHMPISAWDVYTEAVFTFIATKVGRAHSYSRTDITIDAVEFLSTNCTSKENSFNLYYVVCNSEISNYLHVSQWCVQYTV